VNASEDYCDFCELPLSQCVHGQPPPAPVPAKAAPAPRRATPVKRAAAPKAVRLRWTPPEAFKPLILSVLEDSGGELESEELFAELEKVAADRLRPEDNETTPEGELRWRYAARRARVALIDEGLMTKTRPGVWQLARP
jgi:hypothetical protein